MPDNWQFKIDPKDEGVHNAWFNALTQVQGFKSIKVPAHGNAKASRTKTRSTKPLPTPAYDGYAWYRSEVVIPADWKGLKASFKSGAIDDNDWTYVNGKLIGKTTFEDAQIPTKRREPTLFPRAY